jgi:site-specific DNA-methyltransferase (adenine-specific)
MRRLFFGDNLPVMREKIGDESVDLIYLDPPFNSKRPHNINFGSDAQIRAFEDAWQWTNDVQSSLDELKADEPEAYNLLMAFKESLSENSLSAYLVMTTVRLYEPHRVLKPEGSVYLHCDPTASHYLKVIMDLIFGEANFQNNVVWKRTSAHSGSRRWGRVHDVILFYSKSDGHTWNETRAGYDQSYVDKFYRLEDEEGRKFQAIDLTAEGLRGGDSGKPWRGIDPTEKSRHWAIPRSIPAEPDIPENPQEALDYLDSVGRVFWPSKGGVPRLIRYLDEMPGASLQEVITDIPPLSAQAKERLGYPTQKPSLLLERIIEVSSNKGDVVFDPFCGCGTALEAAEKLGRQWIGVDMTHLAIALVELRLKIAFRHKDDFDFEVEGVPKDRDSAAHLAEKDPFQFQYWVCSLLKARPSGGKNNNGADKGVDGIIFFNDEGKNAKAKKVVVSVKGGKKIGPFMVRDLLGAVENEKAAIGLFVSMAEPTEGMKDAADKAGSYVSSMGDASFPKIQLLTVEELLNGIKPKLPGDLASGGLNFKRQKPVEKIPPKMRLF